MTDVATPTVGGTVEPGFESVREAFVKNFTDHGEVGAGVAVHVNGRKVVDLWGGVADISTQQPYDESTLQLVFSTTKGAAAVCGALLFQRGLLDYDAKVVEYWPEFAAAGKAGMPVKYLFCHQAGLPVIDEIAHGRAGLRVDTAHRRARRAKAGLGAGLEARLSRASTYGHLVGELVRRISGKDIGTFFAEEVAGPLGLEFWIGLPESEESRVAPLIPSPPPPPEMVEMMASFMGPDSLGGRALSLGGAFAVEGEMIFNTRGMHARPDPRGERHHERSVAVADVRSVRI